MKDKMLIIGLVASVVLNGYFVFSIQKMEAGYCKMESTHSKYSGFYSELLNLAFINGMTLPEDIEAEDFLGEIIPVKRILNGQNKILFRIPESTCSICVDQEIKYLSTLNKKINNKVILLTSFERFRDYLVFKNSNALDLPCYNVKTKLLTDRTENQPYVGIISPELQITKVFYPKKQNSELSPDYYNMIAKEVFNVEQAIK